MACNGCAQQREQLAIMRQMNMQRRERIALPVEAIGPLMEGVKSWREALLILEPWIETQPPSHAMSMLRRQVRAWRQTMTQLEQQVLANGAT